MTFEDGDLRSTNQKETKGSNKKKKSCYLPPAGGWLHGQDAPDPVAKSRQDLRMARFRSSWKEQAADQRLDVEKKELPYPPVGWEFDR